VAVLEGYAHIQGIITIVDQGNFALDPHCAMRIVVWQTKYANATLDATVGENLFVTADGSDVNTLLDQLGVDIKFAGRRVAQNRLETTEPAGGQCAPFDAFGRRLGETPVDVETVDRSQRFKNIALQFGVPSQITRMRRPRSVSS
jgi:hypothetical protein